MWQNMGYQGADFLFQSSYSKYSCIIGVNLSKNNIFYPQKIDFFDYYTYIYYTFYEQ